jgi:hypothetical protein
LKGRRGNENRNYYLREGKEQRRGRWGLERRGKKKRDGKHSAEQILILKRSMKKIPWLERLTPDQEDTSFIPGRDRTCW